MPRKAQSKTALKLRGRPRDAAVRRRILQASLSLLEENGFSGVTMDAIAMRAGASKATVYRWWTNKAAIVIDAFIERISPELLPPCIDSLDGGIRELLCIFTKVLMGRSGRLLRAVFIAAQNDSEVRRAYQTYWIKPNRKKLHSALEAFRQQGALAKEVDVEQIIDTMYGTLQLLFIMNPRKISLAYSERLANLILNGILSKKP